MSKTSRNVRLLALTSFFNDVASEATLRLLPLFLAQVLGASTGAIGLIEGVSESTATFLKLVSGWLSDRLPRRKPLVVAGYAFSTASRFLFLFATHWTGVLVARFADRVGKGIRTAPRDALIADEAITGNLGASFGLNRAMDTLGALSGLAAAYFVLNSGGGQLNRASFERLVWLASIPGVLAVGIVAFAVREQHRKHIAMATPFPSAAAAARLPRGLWRYLAVLALFTLSNSSDAFLVLRASQGGANAVSFVLLCLLALNLTSVGLALPAGRLSDRLGRRKLIAAGWLVYAACYAGFGLVDPASKLSLILLFFSYGAYYGLADGAEKAFIADLVPDRARRGQAYGLFAFAVGAMNLPASLLFGLAISRWGERSSFLGAAVLAGFAAFLLFALVPEPTRPNRS